MRKLLPTIAVSTLLLAAASSASAQVSFDIHIGHPPPPPRAYHVAPQPGPDYEWVEGYWYPVNGHYVWHQGYWTRPPYQGAYWIQPYYEDGHYFSGRWEGRSGVIAHDHAWDHSRERDGNREQKGNAHNRHGHNDERR